MVIVAVVIAVILDILWTTRKRWVGPASLLLRAWFTALRMIPFRKFAILAELCVLVGWTLWVGRGYLDMNPAHWPTGHEFSSAIQSHVVWLNLFQCGSCVFWNGFVRGGAPAFSDLHGSLLYPLVLPFTLLFGVINASKLMLVAAMFMGGMAQWWLGRILKVGWQARLWAAGMGVASGHLSGRMELGAFGMTLAVAACSLVVAAVLQVFETPNRRSMAAMALLLGTALLAGQGYAQFGLLFGIFPALPIFLVDAREKRRKFFKYFTSACLLAFLIAAVFILPMLHFAPEFYKDTDPYFQTSQSVLDIPFNLVNSNLDLLKTSSAYPVPYPHLFVIYVGWVAIGLVIPGILGLRHRPRILIFFFTGIVLVFFISSGLLFKPFAIFRFEIAAVRHVAQISAMAVPLVLALSTVGLDYLLKKAGKISSSLSKGLVHRKILRWTPELISIVIFAWSWTPVEALSHTWYQTAVLDLGGMNDVLSYLKTPTTQVVNTPYGEHFWIELALESNLKLSRGIRAWNWKGRQLPGAFLDLQRVKDDGDGLILPVDLNIERISHPENEYAAVWLGQQPLKACQAEAVAGNIDVHCDIETPGMLVVQENTWDGWYVKVDGKKTELAKAEDWLAVELPAGEHRVQFRYRPWDAAIGLIASLFGWGWTLALWIGGNKP